MIRRSTSTTEKTAAMKKISSCNEIAAADRLIVRAHHMLCIICFIGGDNNGQPMAASNEYEVWQKIKNNPDIPVTMTEGAGDCCLCPPCNNYIPSRGVCVAPGCLRDRKKSLDTLLALGMSPGDTLPAREIIKRICERIPDASVICAFNPDTSREWTTCGAAHSGRYKKGLAHGVL